MHAHWRWVGIILVGVVLGLALLATIGGCRWVIAYYEQYRLLTAVASGDAATARGLLASGVDPNAERIVLAYTGQYHRLWGLLGRCPKVVLRLVVVPLAPRLGIHVTRERALSLAMHAGSAEVTVLLLDYGADPNIRNQDGRTPLHTACRDWRVRPVSWWRIAPNGTLIVRLQPRGNWDARVASHLLDRGADIEARDRNGYTPLLIAARNGTTDVLQVLLSRGAAPNARDKHGRTALHWTAELNRPQHLKLLLDHGADVNAEDGHGLTPLDLAVHHHRRQAERILREHGGRLGNCRAAAASG
jgi:hypothetical protein